MDDAGNHYQVARVVDDEADEDVMVDSRTGRDEVAEHFLGGTLLRVVSHFVGRVEHPLLQVRVERTPL
jgi:hypothetical protein